MYYNLSMNRESDPEGFKLKGKVLTPDDVLVMVDKMRKAPLSFQGWFLACNL